MLTFTSVRRGLTAAAMVVPMTLMAAPAPPAQAWEVRCTYTVVRDDAPVHENPDTNSIVRKYKNAGEDVTSKHTCGYQVRDPESGVEFTSVNTTDATDNEGWMRSSDLAFPR